jgi:DNA-binding MarR family transcriptional regulator
MYQSKCYCTNLRQSAAAVSEFYDRRLKKTGLSVSQYRLLRNLSRAGSANITQWAEMVGLDRSTMVRNVRPLESRGLIELTEGSGKTYKLSSKGVMTMEQAVPIWNETQKEIRAFLGDDDVDALLRIGKKLQHLNDVGKTDR